MNGACHALETARAAGVDVCFANPGTTEMDLVAALDTVAGMRGVLCLFEGVATGAADAYGRLTGRPALTLLHLGPGFANGIANLHNARRAGSPVVNLIGDHATWHVGADAPLTSDIESLASPVSKRIFRSTSPESFGRDTAEAIVASIGPPAGVSTIIVPQDAAWEETSARAVPVEISPRAVDADAIEAVAALLRERGDRGGLLIGGMVTRGALHAAAAIRAATSCQVWLDTFPARIAQGRDLPTFESIPYFPEQAIEVLGSLSDLVIAGTRAPVAFFGYRSVGRSQLLPDACERHVLSGVGTCPEPDLAALADALGAGTPAVDDRDPVAAVPDGPLDVLTLGAVVAGHLPENAIVVNEAATSGFGFGMQADKAAPHDVLHLTGGAIGQGLPSAVGAAVAAPERPILALQADGSGMYTLQSLWTMAREQLNVTVIVCANRAYRILQMELGRTGNVEPGPNALALTDLSNPHLDWVQMAGGMGVPGTRVETTGELARALGETREPGPFLIEAGV